MISMETKMKIILAIGALWIIVSTIMMIDQGLAYNRLEKQYNQRFKELDDQMENVHYHVIEADKEFLEEIATIENRIIELQKLNAKDLEEIDSLDKKKMEEAEKRKELEDSLLNW